MSIEEIFFEEKCLRDWGNKDTQKHGGESRRLIFEKEFRKSLILDRR